MSPPNERYPDAPQGMDTVRAGDRYQEFVRRLLNPHGIAHWHFQGQGEQYTFGENRQGHEIKLDERCFSRNPEKIPAPTGRLSIEVQEKTRRENNGWVDSGILRADNSWLYVQGNYEIVFVFAKNWLRRVYHTTITPEDIVQHNGTVRKFYLSIEAALLGAALVLDGDGTPLRRDEKGRWRL